MKHPLKIKKLKNLLIMVFVLFGINLTAMETKIEEKESCPTLRYLALGTVVWNVVNGITKEATILETLPEELREDFNRLLNLARRYRKLEEAQKDQEVNNSLKNFYGRLPAIYNTIVCYFFQNPSATVQDLILLQIIKGEDFGFLLRASKLDPNFYVKPAFTMFFELLPKGWTLQQQLIKNVISYLGETTPLIIASVFGKYKVISELVKAGADLNKSSIYGTPLIAAIKSLKFQVPPLDFEDLDLIPIEESEVGDLIYKILQIKEEDILNSIFELLKNGADPNLADKDGDTPLIWAIRRISPDVVRHLLQHGASTAIKTKKGNALEFAQAIKQHLTAAVQDPEVVAKLANINAIIELLEK